MKQENKLTIKVSIAIFIFSTVAACIYRPQKEEVVMVKPEKYIYTPLNYFVVDTIFEKEFIEFLKIEKPLKSKKEHIIFVETDHNKCKLFYMYDAFSIAQRSNLFFFRYDNKVMAASYITNDDIIISKEYVWDVLKDIFPTQYLLYQKGERISADTITENVWHLTFNYIRNSVKREVKKEIIR